MTSLATVAAVLAVAKTLERPVVHVDLSKGSLCAMFKLGEASAPEGTHGMPRHVFNEMRRNRYVDTNLDNHLLSSHNRAYPVRVPVGQAIQAAEENGGRGEGREG
jgi:hypothetical protein